MTYTIDAIELRKAMADAGIFTIAELSEKSGVGRNTIGGILGGTVRPSGSVIERISSTLSLEGSRIGCIFFKETLE